MLTRRGAGALAGAGLLWALGRMFGVNELYVAAVAATILVGVGALSVLLGSATITVRRGVSAIRLPWGRTATVGLDLRNDARLPTSLLLVEDSAPYALAGDPPRFVIAGLPPGRTVHLEHRVTGAARGRFTLGPVTIRVRDPFALAERVRRYKSTDEVIVYPRVEPLAQGMGRGAHRGSGTSETSRLFDQGDEFYTMREYVQGDDLRHVHWPSTAHRQKLMVRQQEQHWEAQATVLLDTRAVAHGAAGGGPSAGTQSPESLEQAVSAAASVAWHFADHHYQLRLVTDADAKTPGVEDWTRILDRLAEVGPSDRRDLIPTLTRLRGAGAEGLLVAVVCPSGSDAADRALIQAGRAFTARCALIMAPSGAKGPAAQRLRSLLSASGWRAAVLTPGGEVAAAWAELLAPVRRTAAPVGAPGQAAR